MRLKAIIGILVTLILFCGLIGVCGTPIMEELIPPPIEEPQPPPGDLWMPYVPNSEQVDLAYWMAGEIAYVNATIQFGTPCYAITDWGTVTKSGYDIWVDSVIWFWLGYCIQMVPPPVSHTYEVGPLENGTYTFKFKAWGTDVKSVSFTVRPTTQLLLETDRDTYILGENVMITLTNIGAETVEIGGYPAWGIYSYPEESLVFPMYYELLLWSLEPGENDTITWDQYNAFTQSPVDPGMYVVRDKHGWGLSAFFEITEEEPQYNDWITATSHYVEMSIENKTTPLGEELSIFMVAPTGAFWLPDTQVFDVYLYDSNYSLFSFWSQNKLFAQKITSVPPGYNATLRWNLYRYDPSTGEYTPSPQGDYYLVGAIMGWEEVTPSILIRINESTITPMAVVNLNPIADFTYSPTFPYVGQAVDFDGSSSSDLDGTIVSYIWDFGDGTVASEADPIIHHTYRMPGTFTATLTVTDDLGATATMKREVTVDPLPTLTITVNKRKTGLTDTIILELADDDYDGFITQDIDNRILNLIRRIHKTTTFNFPGEYTATKGSWRVTVQSRNDFTITFT